MQRWLKITLKIAAILLGIVVLAWLGVAAYVQSNKKQLLESITAQLNKNLNGTLTIEKMEPALIRGFPGISVTLTNVLLRDSLWQQHRHHVLDVQDAYVSVDAYSILKGSPTIKNIVLQNGNIYFYTDSSGYSNTDIFKSSSPGDESDDSGSKKINQISLSNMSMIVENLQKRKKFNFNIDRFTGKLKYNNKNWKGNVRFKTLVNTLAFNTRRGSFLKNKTVEADMEMSFNDADKMLSIPVQPINIGGTDFTVGGKFSTANSSGFALDVKTQEIQLKDAADLLSPNIKSKLKDYTLKLPLTAGASITGSLKPGEDPLIKAYWEVKNNTLTANGETINNCSFTGKFTNEVVKGEGITDPNSSISIYGMEGSWKTIPFKADSITITNLKTPVLAGKFISSFPLSKLNPIFGKGSFDFGSGTAELNLLYKAPFFSKDQSQRYINGHIHVKNATLKYLPRNLEFKNVRALVNFKNQDVFFRNINLQSGGSSLQMEGSIKDFLNLFYTDPQKLLLDWHITSPQINLGQFLSFLGRRQSSKASSGGMNRFSQQLDRMLDEASVNIQMHIKRMIYKKFNASNVNAKFTLRQQGININNVGLSHAGGDLSINGLIDQSGKINQVKLKTVIRKANIQQLFYAFNNFGQTGITSENLRGLFNADCDVSGNMLDNGDVVPNSIRGKVKFKLVNGALVNFEPMEKIGAFAFANRDFSNIELNSLSNTLTLRGSSVTIPPMQIESSVLNIFLEGVYGFSSGTKIAMQVPLRNPEKDKYIFDEAEKERRAKKGIVINLLAVDGDDGNVKIKLGKDKSDD